MSSSDNAVLIAAAFELGKLLLSGYFEAMRLANKTEAEIHATFLEERQKFVMRNPTNLPPPPS